MDRCSRLAGSGGGMRACSVQAQVSAACMLLLPAEFIQRDTSRWRRSFTASFVGEDKSAEISPPRLMARQIMAHVAVATGVPRAPFLVAAAHLKAV